MDTPVQQAASAAGMAGRRILIVEDSPVQAEMLRRFLVSEQVVAAVAGDGREALTAVRADPPELILADISMPVMNGVELCRAIKGDPELRHIPLLLLTTLTDPRDLLEGLAAGADAYLFKPFDEADLLRKLQTFLAAPMPEAEACAPVLFRFQESSYQIATDRERILGFLITVYENALRQNKELREARIKLEEANETLRVRRDELEVSRGRYKALLQNTRTGFFWLSPRGRFLEANPALAAMLGYDDPQQLKQVDAAHDFFADEDGFAALVKRFETEDSLAGVVAGVLRRDRQPIFIEGNLRKAADEFGTVLYYEGFVNDITERLKAQQTIAMLHQRLDLILKSAAEGILALDADGRHVLVNPAAAKMLGYDENELLGRHSHEVWHHTRPDGRPYPGEECPIFTTLKDGTTRRQDEDLFWRQDGSSFPAEYFSAPLRQDGRIVGAVVVFQDITERKRAAAEAHARLEELTRVNGELQELNRRLTDAQNQLLQSEKMASIGQLAAGVAHEINNPIGFVSSNLGTLQRYTDGLLRLVDAYDSGVEEGRKVGQEIDLPFLRQDIVSLVSESQEGVARVTRIVQDLKDFSHVDKSEWLWADINKGLDSTLNVVWNEVKYKAEVVKDYGDIPEVHCMPHQINQVFMNLLLNAAHAIDDRGVITLRTRREVEGVQIEVADTGTGIPPEILPRIFEPFFTTRPVGEGTGLGLSLAYGIVEKHQGRIEVESVVGKGTTFRVWLPVNAEGKEA